MALVRICEEDRTFTDEAEITAHLATCGIDYERWQPSHPFPEDAPPEVVLRAYAKEIDMLKGRGGYVTADVIDVRPETEGLAEMLPESQIRNLPLDEHGHLPLGRFDLGKLVAQLAMKRYEQRTGRKKKCTGLQLGYESRCSPPHAFDVMLGSQLGIGANRALVEEGLDGYMVSVVGQLDLSYVPFRELVNPQTLKTEVRLIRSGSDYHRLARFLETRTDRLMDWSPGRRSER